jgi:hypothetical protein
MLGGALETLFVARALDNRVPLAEANPGPLDPVLLPELGDLVLEARMLSREVRIVLLGEGME